LPNIAANEEDNVSGATGGTRHHIALIPGDGVGPEVVAEAAKVLEAASDVRLTELPWGSAHWRRTGAMMPETAIEEIQRFDAVLLGAVGAPDVPDHISLWGLLLPLRQQLDLWANIRPARLLPGIPSPLGDATPNDIDMLFVRENTEGEYAGAGGRAHYGLQHEVAIEASVFTRTGIERVIRYAFERATTRSDRIISATKSNASRFGYVLWDEIFSAVAAEYPDVAAERILVDALAARMIRDPSSVDVVVASNLFGDILTDLAGAIQGGLGMCASANLAPHTPTPGIFEPVHGSAPDIAGQGIANPSGAIWSAALLLDHLGDNGGKAILYALEDVCADGPRTRDVGGTATTHEVGAAIVDYIERRSTSA
jgi:tartrate dehydrogenase/decarboxylase / D-malate dehydrogenase